MSPHLQIINGSILEGGGQILRNSVSLSALLQKPIRIENIRAGRSQPGLKNQHRTGLDLVARIASAQLTGATNGSTNVEFKPGRIELPGSWKADTVTAGATTLLIQIALPLLLFQTPKSASSSSRPSVLSLLGGTNAEQAPQVDYTQHVFLPFFRKHFLPPSATNATTTTTNDVNSRIKLEIKKRGYYPKGGGEINLCVWPLLPGQKFRAVNLVERSRLVTIHGLAHCAGLPRIVGEGMSQGAVKRIQEWGNKNGLSIADNGVAPAAVAAATAGGETKNPVLMDINVKREPNGSTKGAGSGIVLWAEFENGVVMGGSAVGKKGLDPSQVGKSAAEELIKGIEAGGCVDEWTQDQIIIFMALAEGKSQVRCGTKDLTLHTRTAIWVAEQLTEAKFEVKQEDSGHWTIHCEGTGFSMSG
ncbi:hypothetical protein Agabi119p4_3248 [Agaricus bisporus var. burnettii]|uniref:RNA 3'-terminal-phosphate cyclase (ATP) n=1 Tax=Agaricus bisporus var. burnettii TaxID=192524 RepID=A0A8H7F6R5_AGABI|nr:hypothetical protein Agabi119p4_3248 [Agaricus bisporus var. burnettii]